MNLFTLFLFIFNLNNFTIANDSGSGDSEDSNLNDYTEQDLRRDLFINYDKNTIPVKNNSNSVELLYGITIDGLVFFNQKAETIKINTLTTLVWKDEYLRWDNDNTHIHHSHNPDFIIIPNYLIWRPDLELYNAGSRPEIFETSGISKLYSNGLIIYNRPTSYTFSCKMNLENFPFDTQECELIFGSWKYSKDTLNLRPFKIEELVGIYEKELLNSHSNNNMQTHTLNEYLTTSTPTIMTTTQLNETIGMLTNNSINMNVNEYPIYFQNLKNIKNISVSDSFSHNEWNIDEISVKHEDIEYKCCPGTLWPNTNFKISLKRNPNKYVISLIMAVFITVSSIVINLLSASNFRRTYILVFIPLTLIWLQIHTSSKIPVIQYPTKLEKIIQLCFYTTIISAFESGILYNMILNRVNFLSFLFTEKTYSKMQTLNLFGKYNIIKSSNIFDTNKNFDRYIKIITIFDVAFRFILAITYLSYLMALL
jgi:hypothetical protein